MTKNLRLKEEHESEEAQAKKRLRASVPTAVAGIQYHNNAELSIQGNTYFTQKK
jgi:hypothetical protein